MKEKIEKGISRVLVPLAEHGVLVSWFRFNKLF